MSKILIFLCIPVVLLTCIRWVPGSEGISPHQRVAPANTSRSEAFLRHQQCQATHWRQLMISQ